MKQSKLSKIAYDRVFNDSEWRLRVWWSTTYNKPILHDKIDEYGFEELFQEYLMYKFATDDDFVKDYEEENKIVKKEEGISEDQAWFAKQMGNDLVDDVHEKF
jgi:hypothetical protein